MTTRRWTMLQRNALGMLVVVAALMVIGLSQWRPEWSAYRSATVPAHIAAPGQSARVDGRDWRVDSVRRLGAAEPGMPPLPAGTAAVVVTLARTGPASGQACSGVLTDGERRWSTVANAVPSRADATTLCERPGLLELTFEVPAGVTPSAVDIVGSGAILLRLML